MKTFVLFQIGIISNLFKAYVFMLMWNWFMLDIIKFDISYITALGLCYTIALINPDISIQKIRALNKESITLEEYFRLIFTTFIHTVYILLSGFIISLFI